MKGLMLLAAVGISPGAGESPTWEDSLKAGAVEILPVIEVTAPAYTWSMELPPVREAMPRVLERSGVDLIRRGPSFAADLFVDGFKRSDIAVVVDNQHFYNACPNRMDVPVVRINPLEVHATRLILSSVDVAASLGGVLKVDRRIPGEAVVPMGYLQAFGGAEEGLDVGAAVEGWRHGVYARYTEARPYVDAQGRTFQDLYGYRTDARTAYRVGEISLRGKQASLLYGLSVASYRDVLFPYLLMDERDNLGWEAFVEYEGHRLYANGFRHLMDNGLRTSSAMMPMETDARTWVVGLTRADRYNLVVRRWIADNTMTMMMNGMPMEMSQRMLDILQVRVTATLSRVLNETVQGKVRVGLEYASREDGRDDLLSMVVPQVSRRRMLPLVGVGLQAQQGPVQLFLEGALESMDPEYLFIQLRRGTMNGMQQPYWVGNPDLRQPIKGAVRARLPLRKGGAVLSLETFASYVKDYVEATRTVVQNIPIHTYRNVDALVGGFRLMGQYRFLHLEAHYTWAQNLTDDLPLSEVPPLHVRAELRPRKSWGVWSLSPRLAVTYEAQQDRINPNLQETVTPSWYRLDAGAVVGWKGLRLEVTVENLTNELYYRHLSYLRSPFRSGVKVYEPGRRIAVSLWSGF